MTKSKSFSITIGFVAGYFHGNESDGKIVNRAKAVALLWQNLAQAHFEEYGVYPSAIVQDSLTVYHQDWGCPKGGEATVTLSGCFKPKDNTETELDRWMIAVRRTAMKLKYQLDQSTLRIQWFDTDCEYF